MTNNFKVVLTKNLTYALIIFGLYIIQATPGLLSVWGVKPLLALPAALCIAMLEDDLQGGLMGAFAGLLCDTTSFTAFGFHAILFLLLCTTAAFLVMFAIQVNLTSVLWVCAAAMFIRSSVEYFFFYFIWGYEGASSLYLTKILPNVIWSCLWVPLIFACIRRVKAWFDRRMDV